MINERVGGEFANRQKARTRKVVVYLRAVHFGEERRHGKSREVVAGKEPFRREVAVEVEIAELFRRLSSHFVKKKVHLLFRLSSQAIMALLFLFGKKPIHLLVVRFISLKRRRFEEIAPAIARFVKIALNAADLIVDPLFVIPFRLL